MPGWQKGTKKCGLAAGKGEESRDLVLGKGLGVVQGSVDEEVDRGCSGRK